MNFERKWCHECSGIQLFGEHKGKACCSTMSRILKNRETGEPIRAYMDKETTRNMCRNLGEGCPILTLAEATEADPDPEAAGRLIPGKDFDPVTGEIYEPEDDRRTTDGQTEEQPKNDGKIVVMERAAAQA